MGRDMFQKRDLRGGFCINIFNFEKEVGYQRGFTLVELKIISSLPAIANTASHTPRRGIRISMNR
jgi:hypothetical protein